jgi:WD40 repeat protein
MPSQPLPDEMRQQQLRQACAELDQCLRAGENRCAEDLLNAFPALADHADLVLELIYTEYVIREQLGQKPAVAELYARFPQWEEHLRQLFQVHQLVGDNTIRLEPAGSWDATLPRVETSNGPDANLMAAGEGRKFGSYELLGEIGRGGMGVVYKARQPGLDRIVALKMILAGGHATPVELARFRAEAEAVARFQHPHIVQIYEIGEVEGRPFFSLEYVAGGSLADWLDGTPCSPRPAAQLIGTVARAMHYAHERGIVHRDLKPANVLLQIADCRLQIEKPSPDIFTKSAILNLQSAIPKVTDFGLAKRLGEARGDQTRSGAIVGTPSYMAPEQAGGKSRAIGPATDVYALGAILYELLTGRPPFRAATPLDTLMQVSTEEPVPPGQLQPKLAPDLETICLKCLQKEPCKRYDSALALADDVHRFLSGKPILARPIGAWERLVKWTRRRPAVAALLATVVLVTGLGFGGVTWQWLRAERHRQEAEAALQKAERARQAEKEQHEKADLSFYYQRFSLAHAEWLAFNVARADQLLDECPEGVRNWEWRYLKRLCHTHLATLKGHGGPVTSVVFSPDQRWLASASGKWGTGQPGEIKVWDPAAGKERFSVRLASPVMGVAFSPDGRWLASASVAFVPDQRGGVTIWDVAAGREKLTLPYAGNVFGVAFSPDGQSLATAGGDGRVIVWDPGTGTIKFVCAARHGQTVFGVAFSPDRRRLASCSRDGTVRIWHAGTGRFLGRLRVRTDFRAVAFSPDGKRLASATWTEGVRFWDVAKRREVFNQKVHPGPVVSVTFSPDGERVASADKEGRIHIWGARDGKIVRTLRGHSGAINAVAFGKYGRLLASAGDDRTIRIWDADTQQEARTLYAGSGLKIVRMSFSSESKRLATAGGKSSNYREPQVRVFETLADRRFRVLKGVNTDWVSRVVFSPTGQQLATASHDRTIVVWHVGRREPILIIRGHAGPVTDLAFSPDGKRLVSVDGERTVILWDASSGRKISTLADLPGLVTCVAFHRDGRLAAASRDGTILIWNPGAGPAGVTCRGHVGPVMRVAFSPDGRYLASAGDDATVRIWDLPPASSRGGYVTPLRILEGHTGTVFDLTYSADGRRLASAGEDWTVRLWAVPSGHGVLTLRGHADFVSSVAFSPDGRYLASASGDVKLWETGDFGQDKPTARWQAIDQGAAAWHLREAQRYEIQRRWFAANFHLSRLLKIEPGQRMHLARRGFARLHLGQWDKAFFDWMAVFR